NRILRSSIHNCRRSLWLDLLCRHWLPRTPRYHWLYLPSHLPTSSNPIPLYIRTSLRLRSSSLILTLCRCRLTIPLHLNLLMRRIPPLELQLLEMVIAVSCVCV
ncbi:unnamed protein product, partial [Tetraodon nigroviridis]